MYYYKLLNEQGETLSLQSSSTPIVLPNLIELSKIEWETLMNNLKVSQLADKKKRIAAIREKKIKERLMEIQEQIEIIEPNQIIEVKEEDLL